MNYMDFHCHLDMKDFDSHGETATHRETIIREFFAAGFSRLVTVADPYEPHSFVVTREILSYHKNIFCMAAAHPHNADQYTPAIEKSIIDFIAETRAVGVGEAGLDFHYNLSTPENQLKVFKRQIAIARELQLPLVIHSRTAEPLVLQTLEEEKFAQPVVFHCYTGSVADAREILARGYYISISGIVTFKKAVELRDVAAVVPPDRLFTETDSPYLSPVPFRGKNPNTPLRVQHVAEKVAEIKNLPVTEINNAVNSNFEKVFLS